MAQVIDPVCDMTVDTETTTLISTYQGETFYFCGPGCKKAFEKNPTRYLKREQHDEKSQHNG